MGVSPRESVLLFVLLLGRLLPTTLAFSLVDVQQISGFGRACTSAYSTPFTSCTSNDFYGHKGCSAACADSLAPLLANVNESCNGDTASPNTLIGLIFSGGAFSTLCPGAADSAGRSGSGGGGGSKGNIGQSSLHMSLVTNVVASQTSTALAPTVIQTSSSSFGLHSYLTPMATSSMTPKPLPSSPTSYPTLSTTVSSTKLQIAISTSTTTIPISDLTRVVSTLTTKTAGVASSSTSASKTTTISQQTQASNPQGAGGGTPFDINSSSCRSRKNAWWTASVAPTMISVLLWLV